MSLIIEDKTALDNLANAIIGANGSVTDKSATKSGLIEIINNIIPEKSKFSSGVVIPATEITTDNMPEIPFTLGNDDSGNIIVPDMIVIYQPQAVIGGTGTQDRGIFCIMLPKTVRLDTQPASYMGFYSKAVTGGTTQVGGVTGGCNYNLTDLTDTSFFLRPARTNYNWQAQMPIVWLQIKF